MRIEGTARRFLFPIFAILTAFLCFVATNQRQRRGGQVRRFTSYRLLSR
jgi:hypothetical protein